MVAVRRKFCLVTSNTNYPNSLGPREEWEEDEEGGERQSKTIVDRKTFLYS